MARIFVYDNREFPDPDPELSVDDVRKSLADFYGELSNATVKESARANAESGEDDNIYEFERKVGTKGGRFSEVTEIMAETPEHTIELVELARQHIADTGGFTIIAEADPRWQQAVTDAHEYSGRVSRTFHELERLCRQYLRF